MRSYSTRGISYFPPGRLKCMFHRVADDAKSQKPGKHIEPVNSEGVVVVPKQGGILFVGVVIKSGLAGHVPVFRVSVTVCWHLGTMQMNHGANLRLVGFGAVHAMVDG